MQPEQFVSDALEIRRGTNPVAPLTVRLFGSFELGAEPEIKLASKKAQALLAHLALPAGQSHRRDKLAGLLWGERGDDAARHNLRQTLSSIRKALGAVGSAILASDGDTVALEGDAVDVDVAQFEALVAQGTPESLAAAKALYQGDLLEGLSLREPAFEEWLLAERRRLRELALDAFCRLLDLQIAAEAREEAVQTALRLLAIDPVQESVHRRLMQLYADLGRKDAALRQYKTCVDVLERELGVEPEAETRELHKDISRERASRRPAPAQPVEAVARPAPAETQAPSAAARSALFERPAVAVLPFESIGSEPDEDYFAHGIVEDIITELGRFRNLRVTARNTSFAVAQRNLSLPEIGEALKVRYVLSGSVRRAGDAIRVAAQLTDTTSEHQLWGERYDAKLADVFSVQDRITQSVVSALAIRIEDEVLATAKRRPPDSWQAYDLWLRGMECLHRGTVNADEEARGYFLRALELDQNFARAYSGISLTHFNEWSCRAWDKWEDKERAAFEFARKAVAIDDRDHVTHRILGTIYLYRRDFELAEKHLERALALNPNDADSLIVIGRGLALLGDAERGAELCRAALRLNPQAPDWYFSLCGMAFFAAHRLDEAVALIERAPDFHTHSMVLLAAANAHQGRMQQAEAWARASLEQFQRQVIGGREPEPGELVRWELHVSPFRRPEDADYVVEGLRRAGLECTDTTSDWSENWTSRGPQPARPDPVPAMASCEPERKHVTVLFADIQGSTELVADMDPETALESLDPAMQAMMNAVHLYGGTISNVQGDGIVALFGAPQAQEDHAVRACYAALAMRDSVQAECGGDLQIRVGLHSGEVVVRLVEDGQSRHYDAVGQAMHLASRVERSVVPGVIGMTAETQRRADGFVAVRSVGLTPIKGLGEPVDLYELTGRKPARSRWDGRASRTLSKFVGRQQELAKLGRALERSGTGRGEVVAIVGEPGMGKSRLVHEFVSSPATEGWTVLEAGAVPYDAKASFRPISDLLRSWLAVEERDGPADIAAKLRDKIAALGEELLPVLPALQSVLNLPVEDPEWPTLDASLRRRRIIDAARAMLLRGSHHQPHVLVFEDLHWIDGESQSVLDAVVEALPGARVLVLVTYRPEYTQEWAAKSYFRLIRADPLEPAAAGALLDALLGDDPSLSELKPLLVDRTDGRPLFVEESVSALVDAGRLRGETGAYQLTGSVETLDIPSTIREVLADRIDRLTPACKSLLQVASVVGRHVPRAVLEAVAGLSEDELEARFSELRAAELVYESRILPEVEYSFKHALTHQVAYQGILRERRRTLHAEVVRVIERRYHNRLDEQIERLAEHAFAGGLWPEAAAYLLSAADKAKQQYAYQNAEAFARKALDATERDAGLRRDRVRALVLLGDLASLKGDITGANADYDQAAEIEVDPQARARIVHRRHATGSIRRGGGEIAYYEHGDGDRTLLFCHPFVYGLSVFQPILEILCEEFRIITVDGRGTGASDPLPGRYDMDDHVADYRAVIETVGNGQPITGVGISRGVNLLVKLAIAAPGMIDKIVLVGGNFAQTRGVDVDAPASDSPAEARFHRLFAEALKRRKIKTAMRMFAPLIFSEPGSQELREQFVEHCLRLPPETVINFFTLDPKTDIEALVPRIEMPTLIMHGTADRDTPFEAAVDLARQIPAAQLYPFEDKGHLPTFTATREFCHVLTEFTRGEPVGK